MKMCTASTICMKIAFCHVEYSKLTASSPHSMPLCILIKSLYAYSVVDSHTPFEVLDTNHISSMKAGLFLSSL